MSSHELRPRPGVAGVTRAVVGWDRPLQTFFAQVFNTDEDGEEHAFIWVGTDPGELATPEQALAIVESYAVVPPKLAATLDADLRSSIGVRDGAEQRRAKQALFGRLH